MTNANPSIASGDDALKHRRPIKSRGTARASATARFLKNIGLRPNTVSVFSIVFALLSGLSFFALSYGVAKPALLFFGALFIQFRLLCNLFDGMIAVEGGLKSKTGDIYNELPDRVSDVLIIVGVGYGIGSVEWAQPLAWLAACLALTTAYVRALGVSLGTKSFFLGPMAKPHRMATLTVGALAGIVEVLVNGSDWILLSALVLVAAGSVITVIRRTLAIAHELERR
jgi:phosphatidylglycerophosphate synthase